MLKSLSALLLSVLLTGTAVSLSAADAAIAGKWHFVFETEGGTRVIEPVFQLNGNQVTGKWENDDVQGTFSDGNLKLKFTVNSDEGGRGTLIIKGRLQNDELTGTWSFQAYDGQFKATRAGQGS